MLTKTCTVCKVEKPATEEFFHRAKESKYGLCSICKECRMKYIKTIKKESNLDPTITKICSECNKKLPATPEYFHVSKIEKYGVGSKCKNCRKRDAFENRAKKIKIKPNEDITITKICTECNNEFPATNDFFHAHSENKYGLSSKCKKCRNLRCNFHNKRTNKKLNKNLNITKVCTGCSKIFPATIEYFNRYKLGKSGVDCKCKECRQKEARIYYKNNKEKSLIKYHKYRTVKQGNGGSFTCKQIHNMYIQQNKKCKVCREEFGSKKYHIDHIIPISKGGSSDISNIQLLCKKCNLSKGNKNLEDWLEDIGYKVII